jgi:hypothetical protein
LTRRRAIRSWETGQEPARNRFQTPGASSGDRASLAGRMDLQCLEGGLQIFPQALDLPYTMDHPKTVFLAWTAWYTDVQ